MRVPPKLGAVVGIVGPIVFVTAWIVGSLRQTGHRLATIQISGLAALDARDPWIMMLGFIILGAAMVVFGAALRRSLAGAHRSGPGPWLVQLCGVAAMCAGFFRRDRMAVGPPSLMPDQSWHNHAHDLASALIYIGQLVALVVLARQFRGDPHWGVLQYPILLTASVTALTQLAFFARIAQAHDAELQLFAVILSLAALVLVALWLFAVPRRTDSDR